MEVLTTIILASNEGARMKSSRPVYSHGICGQAMIAFVIEAGLQTGTSTQVLALEQKEDYIKGLISDDTVIICQNDDLCSDNVTSNIKGIIEQNPKGTVLLLPSNYPAIEAKTLKAAYEYHSAGKNQVTVLSTHEGSISDICFISVEAMELLDLNDIGKIIYKLHKEDIIKKFIAKGIEVSNYTVSQTEELIYVNNRSMLNKAEQVIQNRIINKHMENGVTFHLPSTCIIHPSAKIGEDTEIYQGTIIKGATIIGKGCTVGPNTLIEDSVLGNYVEAINSVILESEVGNNTNVGPFAYIRPESKIGEHIKIGDFVEIKKAVIGDYSKVSHLSYIGDAEIGKNVNIGCGTITVNYDGKKKHKTIVEDNAFIGCNANLISPVVIKKNAFIAAGSTITDEVPEYSLAIARSHQTIIADWVRRKGLDKK